MRHYMQPISPVSGGIHSQPSAHSYSDNPTIDIERATELDADLVYYDLRNSLDATDLIPCGSVRAIDYETFVIGKSTVKR